MVTLYHSINRNLGWGRKILTLLVMLLAMGAQQISADDLKPSTKLPTDGDDKEGEINMYVIKNANNPIAYWGSNLKPVTKSDFGQFAFYQVTAEEAEVGEGIDLTNAYYIYDCSVNQWLTYTPKDQYNCRRNNTADSKNFVTLSDTKNVKAYFFASKAENYPNYYEFVPALSTGKPANTTNGNPSACYINYHGGITGELANNTLGLWQDHGRQDAGSRWNLSTPSGGGTIAVSTFPAQIGTRLKNVYTMHNGYGCGVNSKLNPSTTSHGHFAFEAVENVEGAYYIYDYSANKWLTYTRKSQAEYATPQKDFVTLSDTKVDDAYFYISVCTPGFYEIVPCTTEGAKATATYLNYYLGVDKNQTNTIGFYSHTGSQDAGSRWRFDATEAADTRTISEQDDLQNYEAQGDVNITLTRTLSSTYWNTFCVPFNISEDLVKQKFGADCMIHEFTSVGESSEGDGNTVMKFTPATSIEAGKPYLIKPSQNVVNPTFTNYFITAGEPKTISQTEDGTGKVFKMLGIYGKKKIGESGDKTKLFLGTDNCFYYPNTNNPLRGMRAYFEVPTGTNNKNMVVRIDDNVTSLDNVEVETEACSPVYNLQGQCVGTSLRGLVKGVYIQNGKKYVVR